MNVEVREVQPGEGAAAPAPGLGGTLREAVSRLEAAMLEEAMARHGTQAGAARALGVTQSTICRKLKQHGLE